MRAILTLTLAVSCLCAGSAAGQLELRGAGPRVGLTSAPDQVVLGGHLDLGEFTRDLAFRPHASLGIGDDLFTLAPAADVYYRFTLPDTTWRPTLGGTLGLLYVNPDRGRDNTDLELMLALGIEKVLAGGTGFHFELKFEMVDAPDLTLLTSWTF